MKHLTHLNFRCILLVLLTNLIILPFYGQVARNLSPSELVADTLKENNEILAQRYDEMKYAPELIKRGSAHEYKGPYLKAIKFPVGGIGTGCIQFDGQAIPRFWQIFNNMSYNLVPNSFMAVRIKEGNKKIIRALQTKDVNDFKRMKALTCKNEFPFISYDFEDTLPVAITLKVYNPFIPTNLLDSSIPAVFYQVTVKNTSNNEVTFDLLASQQNAIGFGKAEPVSGNSFSERYQNCINRRLVNQNKSKLYGGNINTITNIADAKVLLMNSTLHKEDTHYGQMALVLFDKQNKLVTTSASANWKDNNTLFSDFQKDGKLKNIKTTKPSPNGATYSGAITANTVLKPNESRVFNLALVWYFPNGKNGGYLKKWDAWGKGKWQGIGNKYATNWKSIKDLITYISQHRKQLDETSKKFHKTFSETNLPYWLVERLSSQLAILQSRTIFHDSTNYVGLWEGCGAGDGSCAGNCNHVWHYAQAHARLFPELGRRIREQAYEHIKPNGQIPYRQPAGSEAFDGQCGDILATYREHLMNTNKNWLIKEYPDVKKALEYLINTWDKNQDGWLEGRMHTTYDCSMSGNPSFLTSLYLATLKASVKMAQLCNDQNQAKDWNKLYTKASKIQNERLWNGEYFIQVPDSLHKGNDYIDGCHSDQLLGQWWADQLGLGDLFPPYRLHQAYNAILKYNFKPLIDYHKQRPRKFAEDGEAAFVVTTWPNNNRPKEAPGYSDEIWSTYEYTIACSLFKQQQPLDALTLLSAGAKRYDGKLRTDYFGDWGNFGFSGNPFGDDECGQFYSRALSNWSVLLAIQGFNYDGPQGKLSFSPTWKPENHRSFFSTAQGWGLFSQQINDDIQQNSLELRYGTLILNTLCIDQLLGDSSQRVEVTMNDKPIEVSATLSKNKWILSFKNLKLRSDDKLIIKII